MKLKILTIILLGLIVTTACDKNFEEINSNPNDPTTVPSGLLIADVVRVASNILYDTFVGGDMGACWAQHWGKVQYNDEERYLPREGVIEDMWKSYYEDVISDSKTMGDIALTEENANMQGVALTLQAYGYAVLTDAFGNVPFSEAMRADEGIFSPSYDSQDAIYDGILSMLDQANAFFNDGTGVINPDSDILYGGDASKWQKFANSLKFRALMRISAMRDVSSDLQALMSRPMFASNDDEAKLIYLAADPNANPIFERIVFGTRGEFKVNEVLVNMLTDLNDPRLPVYVQPNDAGEYRGKPAGIRDVPNDDYDYVNVSAIGTRYLEATAPGYFMSNAELHFLMAEAASKGFISGSASAHYETAIHASFAANGLSAAAAAAYLAQGSVALNGTGDLQKIAEQNWLGLFCQGFEAWTEYRRTGFPVLQAAIDGEYNEVPSRYTYPAIEQSVNASSYQSAVSAQGANLLTTKLWWDN